MRTVLVTGGVRRLGKAIADGLAESGWRVIRSSSRAEAGADVVCDLSCPGAADELFAKACEIAGGCLDALVNNAALYIGADISAIDSVNFASPRRLVELMAEHGGACAVNSVDAAVLPLTGHVDGNCGVVSLEADAAAAAIGRSGARAAYVDTKRRLLDFTLCAAREYASVGLRVNAVAPGPVLPPEGLHEKASATPLGRPTPQAVADAVSFLLNASFTTAAVIPVRGL